MVVNRTTCGPRIGDSPDYAQVISRFHLWCAQRRQRESLSEGKRLMVKTVLAARNIAPSSALLLLSIHGHNVNPLFLTKCTVNTKHVFFQKVFICEDSRIPLQR